MKEIQLSKSKSGLMTITEYGGGMSNTGSARIIADKNGEKKTALIVFNRGQLSCSDHAVLAVDDGDYIINVRRHHSDYRIEVNHVVYADPFEEKAYCESKTYHYDGKSWGANIPEIPSKAIHAGIKKTEHYHCRIPYYVNRKKK